LIPVHVGTSGWHYAHWRGGFYPSGLPAVRWLDYYAERFATVEINNVFYRLPPAETFDRWRKELPDGFVVAVKASRYITHVRRLKDTGAVTTLMDRATHLGDRLGPVLLQLPPNLAVDADALDATLAAFGPSTRVAVEARHPSWFVDDVRSVLESRRAALCLVDGGPVKVPVWRTASWTYLRLHGGRAQPPSCYGRSPLATWVKRLAELWSPSDDAYCYFNNDAHGCALRDARRFAVVAGRAGLRPSRVPARNETPVT
jgi:uncharacterized protein YecE (DUF72 family)